MIPRRRRWPIRRRFGSRGRFRPFAKRVRPKYDRISLFNTLGGDRTEGVILNGDPDGQLLPCGPIVSPECSQTAADCAPCAEPPCLDRIPVCCAKVTTMRLLNQTTLQDYFQDRVTVVSLYGDVWCRSFVPLRTGAQLCSSATELPSLEQFYARFSENWNVAIRKMNQTQQELVTSADPADFTPIKDFATPLYDYDWTEARWLYQRNRFWAPKPKRTEEWLTMGSQMGCCPDVHGGATNVVPPIASGSQPTYDINTNVSTSCNPCLATTESCPSLIRHFEVDEPPWHHFRIRVRRHISLRADEMLDLQVSRRHPVMYPSGANPSGWGCGGDALPPETSTMIIHVKMGAVVRLN